MSTNRLPPDDRHGQGEPLAADATTPWIGVNVLAQTVFCPRAGLLTQELGHTDDGEDKDLGHITRMDWLPDYEEALINEALDAVWNEVRRVLNYGLWWITMCIAIGFAFDYVLAIVLAVPVLLFLPWFWRRIWVIAELARRRRAARTAPNTLSIDDLGKEERIVNWWSLRKAGFSVQPARDRHSDTTWALSGRPFRILQFGSLRIPVVRKHRGKHEVHSQNRARVAAYCHLIEELEGARSPFGVFMFAGSYDVYIIPNSPRNRSLFHNGLRQARKVLEDVPRGDLPDPPMGNQCAGCPFGYPRVRQLGTTDNHLAVLRGSYTPARGADRHDYHSVCGDRFEWLPPHDKAQEKELKRLS